MNNYKYLIHSYWNEYTNINDISYDDSFFIRRYNKIGIYTRKEWYILKDKHPDILIKFFDYLKDKEKLYDEKGISCISGSLMKTVKGCGPKDKDHKGNEPSDINDYIRPSFALEDIFAFNIDDMLKCKPDKNVSLLNKIDNISFDRVNEIYDELFKDKYLQFKEQYELDKTNGNLDKIKYVACRLSTYAIENNLNMDENYSDGGVICNIGIITSEYIQTGILDTNIKRFENYTIEKLNEYYNTYVIFILLNIFTCCQHCYQMTIHGIIDREKWYVNLFRRRMTNKPMRSTCVLPRFIRDKYGNINLYCDTYNDCDN